jgi:ABC-type cobalamin/Fe3+-siderophores transport system ATPase subunit
VGNLGKEKGDLYCKTSVIFQDGAISGKHYNPIAKIKKTPQKDFCKHIKEIYDCVYASNLFEKISDLNKIEDVDSITSLYELILFSRYFVKKDEYYEPSNGESSMLLLHKELSDDKDVYILDEPEKSLGNDYISDVIVPLIKEKAKSGKKVFIATHDANIAVRTLPYNSIYRSGECKTYVGNPFSNSLVNIDDLNDKKDWKAISMKRLEGGKEAFGERGKIYGHI